LKEFGASQRKANANAERSMSNAQWKKMEWRSIGTENAEPRTPNTEGKEMKW
jgi:hypothetical protein